MQRSCRTETLPGWMVVGNRVVTTKKIGSFDKVYVSLLIPGSSPQKKPTKRQKIYILGRSRYIHIYIYCIYIYIYRFDGW